MVSTTHAKKLSSMMNHRKPTLRTRKCKSAEPLKPAKYTNGKRQLRKQASTSSSSTSVSEGSAKVIDEIQPAKSRSGKRKKLSQQIGSVEPSSRESSVSNKGQYEKETSTSLSSTSIVEDGVNVMDKLQTTKRRSSRQKQLPTKEIEPNNNDNGNTPDCEQIVRPVKRKRAGKFFDFKELRKQEALDESDSNSSNRPSSGSSSQSRGQSARVKSSGKESSSESVLKNSLKDQVKCSADDEKGSEKSIGSKLSEMHSSETQTQKGSRKRSSAKNRPSEAQSAKTPTSTSSKVPRRSTAKTISYKEAATSDDSDKDSDFNPLDDPVSGSSFDSSAEEEEDVHSRVQASKSTSKRTPVVKSVAGLDIEKTVAKKGKRKSGGWKEPPPKKSNQLVVGKVPFNHEALAKFKMKKQSLSTSKPHDASSSASPKKVKSETAKSQSTSNDAASSSDDDDAADWEEVKDLPTEVKDVQITVDNAKEKKKGWDWFTYSKQLWRRYMKFEHEYRHKVELLCLLSSGQQLNSVCNNDFFKALTLSASEKTSLKGKKCTEANIANALSTLKKKVKLVPKALSQSSINSETLLDTLEKGLLTGELHRADEVLLFVLGMLRALGASARLCVAWYPVPIRIAHFQKLQQIAKAEASGSKMKGKVNFPFTADKIGKQDEQLWLEVYDASAQKWLTIGTSRTILTEASEVEQKLSKPITYIVSYDNDGKLKDLTQKYDSKWMTGTAKLRVADKWWKETISPYRPRESKKTKEEDNQLQNNLEQMPFPNTISGFKDHPLYALERHLLKFEALYPRTAVPMGYTKTKEPIYSRSCVHELHSREQWLKEALQVKMGEEPYKFVKPRPSFKDWKNGIKRTEATLGTFGRWQTEPYVPATAENGIVPKNAYGNVDLYQPQMLPKGCVQIRVDSIGKIARKMGIDCAPAMVGWQLRSSANVPLFDGWVVCKEFEDALLAAVDDYEEEEERKAQEKVEKRVYGHWKTLIKGLLIREKLRLRYGKDNF